MSKLSRALWRADRDVLSDKAFNALETYGPDSAHFDAAYDELHEHVESKSERLGHAADRLRGAR